MVSGCHLYTNYILLKRPMAWKLRDLRILWCRMVIVLSEILQFEALVYYLWHSYRIFCCTYCLINSPFQLKPFCVFLVLTKTTSMLIHWHLILLCWATVYIDIYTSLLEPPSLHHKSPLYLSVWWALIFKIRVQLDKCNQSLLFKASFMCIWILSKVLGHSYYCAGLSELWFWIHSRTIIHFLHLFTFPVHLDIKQGTWS